MINEGKALRDRIVELRSGVARHGDRRMVLQLSTLVTLLDHYDAAIAREIERVKVPVYDPPPIKEPVIMGVQDFDIPVNPFAPRRKGLPK